MASNVFGNPITDETLKGMPHEYANKTITQLDRAHVALTMKNTKNKDVEARKYGENMRKQWGTGGFSTLCFVYNATGDRVIFSKSSQDGVGHIGPDPYPVLIENGQWGVFLHVNATTRGSSAAVVYHGKNGARVDCVWILAWSNAYDNISKNKVYTWVCKFEHFDENQWETISSVIDEQGGPMYTDEGNGCVSYVSIGNDSTRTVFEGIMTLKNA